MSAAYHRLLMVFVDGVGLAPQGPDNPLSTEPMPFVRALVGGPLTLESCAQRPGVVLDAMDANLDVEGLPQSVTGQVSLFTGVNAARIVGRHVTGFLGPELREVVGDRGIFRQVVRRGATTTFANAFGPRPSIARRRRGGSVTTWAVESAGLELRDVDDLIADRAVSWDVTRHRFRTIASVAVPEVEAVEAGRHLASIAGAHDFTLFETFLTDLAGHGRFGATPAEALERLDGLLSGAIGTRRADRAGPLTLVLTSDHGNLESTATRVHTRNPVPLLAVGPLASSFVGLDSILDVVPRLLSLIESRG